MKAPSPAGGGQAAAAPGQIRRLAGELYRGCPPLIRLLQRNRDRICPLGVLLEEVPPGSRVLDVGCGAGLLALLLAATGRAAEVVGVDRSEAAIAAARRAAGRLPAVGGPTAAPVRFHCAAGETDWPAGPFDVVCLVDVLHHVPPADRRAFLTAAAGRVGAGGRLVYKDMCIRPAWRAWANRLHDLLLARQWVRHVAAADVERWAQEAGLSVARRRRYARWVYGHELVVFRRAPGGNS